MEVVELYYRCVIDNWYDIMVDCFEDFFWFDVKGDLMIVLVGLSIFEGMIIFVDLEVELCNGKLVVVKFEGENEVIFKKLVIDVGRKFLKLFNL